MSERARDNKYLKVIIDFGIPSHLCCDKGSQFQGTIFQDLLTLVDRDTNGYNIYPYSHEENSIVKQANKELLTVLRCLVLEKRLRDDWDILCHVSKRIINSRVHSAIGVSPADLTFQIASGGRIDLQRESLFPYTITEQQATPEFLIDMQKNKRKYCVRQPDYKTQKSVSKTMTLLQRLLPFLFIATS
jgi:hypothetical protein